MLVESKQVILVTGATGYIGSRLLHELLLRFGDGWRIRALVRHGSSKEALEVLPVELVYGDLMDPVSLIEACQGVSVVFNCAGHIAYSRNQLGVLYNVNVRGTAALVDACLECGVGRLVHTSSVAAIGVAPKGLPATEETTFREWQHRIAYMESKHLAEMECMRGVAEGLEVVMVNPAVVVGRGRTAGGVENASTRAIRDIYMGRIPVYPSGGISLVGIDDVVQAHIAAWQNGVSANRYIITAGNYSFRELFTTVRQLPGGSGKPVFEAALAFQKLAGMAGELFALVTGGRPYISVESMRLAREQLFYSNQRSLTELEIQYQSVEEVLSSILGDAFSSQSSL
ncbi:NAD-dependent epimerase/dehydratase family protein [Prosthecochloris vibrioformis]|uniref:NAD-dependent epimerase/dehydratase family protein n=1 Tax=Prosthecochloris vibrioformis TaxID=1098 RepID=A0A5C4S304_PROVB|nr:NAD-dependent epimerase/dehydratase family protein [Prosthecochloris vibrioformis]TNJ37870.1 NAD-dependent epimerase/dehydratase family protein [Prosthecochloris vibrioformis]